MEMQEHLALPYHEDRNRKVPAGAFRFHLFRVQHLAPPTFHSLYRKLFPLGGEILDLMD
jgi:hypothetical protein